MLLSCKLRDAEPQSRNHAYVVAHHGVPVYVFIWMVSRWEGLREQRGERGKVCVFHQCYRKACEPWKAGPPSTPHEGKTTSSNTFKNKVSGLFIWCVLIFSSECINSSNCLRNVSRICMHHFLILFVFHARPHPFISMWWHHCLVPPGSQPRPAAATVS